MCTDTCGRGGGGVALGQYVQRSGVRARWEEREGTTPIERGDKGIHYFLCLRLNGYMALLFIVLEDLVLKQSNFAETSLIVADCFHNKYLFILLEKISIYFI